MRHKAVCKFQKFSFQLLEIVELQCNSYVETLQWRKFLKKSLFIWQDILQEEEKLNISSDVG